MNFKKFLETKSISESAFAEMEADKQAGVHTEFLNELSKSIDGSATKESVETLKTELSKVATKEALKGLESQIESVATKLTEMNTEGKEAKTQTLSKALQDNKEKLKSIADGTKGNVVIKATTNRASIANNDQAYELTDIGQLATRKLSMYDIFPKIPVSESNNNGVIRYYDWNEDTINRAAAAVAEGAQFPESTAKFKKGTITIEKIGDTLPVTEDFFEDEEMFAAELEMFLDTNVQLEMDRQLCLGDGTNNQIKGLFPSINAYSPSEEGISDPSIYDLIVKLKEAITTNGGSKYSPDFVVMNIADINKMKLKKDANDNYIIPPFVSREGTVVDGILVIESNIVTANTMAIGERRYGRIYNKTGIEISEGMVNDQFTQDTMTLKARKRLAFLIREADKGGFLKVNDIAAALVTLGS